MLTRTDRRRFPILLAVIAALALAMAMPFSMVHAQEGSAPDKPTGLTIASVSHDSVELDWDDSGDSSITHYQVFRRDRAVHEAGEFVTIEEDTRSTATEYTDATVEADKEYVYRVKAVNAHGASPWSDHVRADTPTGPGQEAVYTYEDGDRTIRVILQGDLVVQETGADTPSGDVVRRTAGGNIVRKQSGQGGADLPVFRSASGGALMTLPGGVLLALDPEWDEAGVNRFFERNNIWKGRVSELDYIPNGFFVRTEPGFPSLELANALAAQKGVLVSSPNWWREVEAKQDPEETKGDGGRAAQETGDIEDGFMNASDLPLGTTYNDSIDPPEDYDFFKLDLSSQSAATDVRIYTTGEFDTAGLLFDSDEMLLMSDNDGIGTRNFSMLASLLPGVYYVVVFGAPYAYSSNSTDTGNYTLHAEAVTMTSLSLDSSMDPSIGAATEVGYFRLDLSGQTENTDLSVFAVSDDLMPFIEAPSGSLDALRTVDALGDRKWVVHWSDDSLSPGVYPFAVGSRDGDTGDYTLRAVAVPDHGSTRVTATTLILDAPTSGKLTSTSDADYFKLVLTEAKDLAILAFARVNAAILDSSGKEIPVNKEIVAGGFNRIIDDFASGTYYVKITTTVYVSDGPLVSNTSQPPATTVDMRSNAFAQAFTTGTHSAGYPLSSVEIVSQDAESDEFTVAVYTVDDDGHPATLHAPLTAPDSFAAGTLVFTAPANIRTLKPNTTYALVFNRPLGSTTTVSLGSTTSDAEDSGPAAGWSIANNYYYKNSGSTVWQQTGTRKSIRIAIEGPATADYALYAYEDTGYGTWVDGCADDTNDLGSSTINDPLYACQWHLNSDDSADMDMNVESVWADGITGAGVNVAVVDETIDYSHADLSSNINSALNHDYGARSNAYRPAEHHGTNVAGVIAARDNTIGVRGVAPRATIYGYNLLEEGGISTTDADEADAMARNRVATAVSNNSWGPVDGYGFDHAPAVWEMAIDSGVTEGYAGKGVFYAWAGGNGGRPGVGFFRGDNSNFDEYANYYGVTAVCAVGDDGIRAAYSEQGANLWACAPSGGGDRGIVTTENSDRYINDFGGTSSATPKVAGVAALLRHANPDLTWRDLKLILAASARQNDPTNIGWEEGARKYGTTDDADRYHFNHEYGFGVVDAAAAVALAQDWSTLPEFKNASSASGTLDRTIPDYTASGITSSLSLDTEIDFTEFVEVTVTIDHIFWRDLRIELVSPAGRVSTLAVPVVFIGTPIRPADSTVSPATFRFGSAKHLGENPNGKWTLRVTDELERDQGTLTSWSITVYGHDNPVRAVSTGRTTATATVELHNPDSESLTVHLRYSDDDGTTWSTTAMQTTTGTSVDFALTGLAPNAKYLLEASLDSTFGESSDFAAGFVNRPANRDIDTLAAAGNTFPVGLWSDGTTIWVADFEDDKLYAYTLATGARNSDKDFDTLAAAGNTESTSLWSDGTTIWVSDSDDDKLYAYTLATGARDSDKDFDLHFTNPHPHGVWSDGTTIWVVNNGRGLGNKIYAYTLATGARDSDKDFDTLAAAGNINPYGLWSDSSTMWVANYGTTLSDAKIYAYTLATGARDSDRDIDTLSAAGNDDARGLWSDDTTIWVADSEGDKLYAYYIEVNARTPVNPAPDLVVESTSVINSNPAAGASFTLSATVRNQGTVAAGSTTLRYYRSTDATIDTNDTSVGTDRVSGLAAAGTSAESISLTAPSSAGTYYYGACVDAVTNESNTTNNCSAAVAVTVGAPQQPNTSLSPSAIDPSVDPSTAVYTVTFQGQWTAAATPGGVPGGAHFSRLIGAVHNSGATFLQSGEAASDGVESMAEVGGWTSLRDEVVNAGTNALNVLTGDTDNIGPTSSEALTVTLTADHPRVTLLTMVAPSPDWFVGVSGLTLLDAGGDWVESLQVDLFPWDAGTEDGSGFSLSNSATSPQGVITNLRGTGKFSNARIATLTFTRQSVNTAPTGTPTFIGAQRVGEVLRVDTSSIDDPDGFTNRDFSFTWLADNDLMELGSFLRGLGLVNAYEIAPYDAGMTIKVQIYFDDDLGNHEFINLQAPSTVAAVAPDQPGNLSASLGNPGELDLSWSTPAVCDFTLVFDCWLGLDRTFNVGDGGSDITGYTVQWKLSSGDWGTASDVSEAEISETSYTITGLVSSNTYTVRVRARNVAGLGTPSTEVTVSGADLNVGPVVSGRASPYFFEFDPSPRDVTTYTATDPESDGITWSLSGDDASFFSITNGVLNFDSAGDFEDPQDVGGNNAYDLNVLASDGQNTATFPVTVVIYDVEDERPVITGDDTLTFAEYTDTTTILQTYSATDPEGVNTTFTWTLAGTDSGDFEISDAGALTFKNVPDFDSPADSDGDNVYTVQVRAYDGTETGRLDVTVTVTNVNEAPTTPTGREAITVAENTAGNLARYSATDPDKDDTVMWDVSGTDANAFRIGSSGNLAFDGTPDHENPTDSGGNNVYEVSVDAKDAEFTSSLDVTVTVEDVDEPPEITGATTIDDYDENGTGNVATYTAADPEGDSTITWTLGGTDWGDFDITGGVLTFKSAPDYERPADSGRNNEYSIQIRANDGSLTGTRNVTVIVNDTNEPPTIAGDATLSYPENTATTRVLDRYRATDPEGRQITWSVSGTDATGFRIDGSGNLYFDGQPDYDAPSDSGGDNEYNFRVVATDDGNLGDGTPSLLGILSSSFDVTLTVTAVNEPPTVIGQDELTLFENDENFSESYSASDPEGVASTFAWSVAGTDGADFNIDRSTGELTFRNIPNYESPADSNRNNEYLVTVRATDEGGLSGSLDVTVTVENVDEPPTITGSATPSDFPENSVRSVATYGATDPELRTITWGLSGTDSDDFNIDQGALTFKNIPDFEKPTDSNQDNEYLVTVQATDDGGKTSSLDVTVTVINSTGAEEPSITTSRPSLTLQENGTGTIYTFRARDPQGRPVTWSLEGADKGDFTISGGALTFNGSPDFEHPADDNGDNVYELTVVVTDDQGLTDSFDFTVTVTNHHENREPAITTSPSSGLTYQKLHYQENLISTVHTYRARNYGPGSISWTLRGPDFDSFDINELGALTFKSAPNYEAPGALGGDNDYEIAVVASNSGGYSDRLNVVITVTDVNEGPEVSGPSTFTIAENERLSNAVYTARDPEGLDVTRWTVGGRDGGDFTITPDGVLTFRNIPDFERPADSGGDNVYEVTVRPYDGRYYGSFDVTVTVTDVNEPPTITTTSSSATALRQNENVTSRLYTYRATDPEGADTVTWSVGGDDKDFFTIDERGQFSFKEDSPPDYEEPEDSGRDNVYDVVVQATDDGVNVDTLDVTVTVREVNEGPEVTSGSPSFTISENQDLPSAVYTGFDPEGGMVTRWTVGGTDGGDFTISQEGVLTFRNTPDFERPADSNRDNIYELQVRPYDGRYYGSFDVTVTVTDVNEPPTITTTNSSATALRQNENETSRLYTYRATDPEGADTVTCRWREWTRGSLT